MKLSIVNKSNIDEVSFRIDAEFYHPEELSLQYNLEKINLISLDNAKARLDCSAFYPSIVPYYNFQKIGTPFLRVNEIQNGMIAISDETVFLPESILKENSSTIALCNCGDLLIAKGGNSLAKVALLTNQYSIYSACRDVIIIRTENLYGINKYYLWIFLHSETGKKILLRTASQTGQPHLTVEAISKLSIPLFSNLFQIKFESIYNESQIKTNKSVFFYKQAQKILLSELGLINWKPKHQLSFVKKFSDVEKDWRMDAEYYQPKYDELIEKISSSSVYSKTIAEIQTYNARGLQPEYDETGELDVIASRHILENGLDYDSFEKTDSANWNIQKKARVYKGDILTYTTGANIGRTAYYSSNKQALASNHVNILRIKDEQPEYVAFVMNSMVGRLQTDRLSAGSAQAELYPKDIEKYVIPFIAEQAQQNIISSLEESMILKEQSNHLLECAKRAIEIAIEQDEQTAIEWLERETA